MKHLFTAACMLLFASVCSAQNNVGIGTTNPHPSALLQLEASDKGLLMPVMSTAQRMAIQSPAYGLMVIDSTVGCPFVRIGNMWQSMCAGASQIHDTVYISSPVAECLDVDSYFITPQQHFYLNTQPITALASPGPGKSRIVLEVQFHVGPGAPYAAGGELKVYIGSNCIGAIKCAVFGETGEVTVRMVLNTSNVDQRDLVDQPIYLMSDYDASPVLFGDRTTKVVLVTKTIDL